MSGGMEDAELIGPEQAADLQALQAAAQAQPLPAGAPVPDVPPVQSLADEFVSVSGIALAVLAVPYPSLSAIWTDEARAAVAASAAAVCEKHGWLAGGFMGDWGAEVALLVTAGPLVVASVAAARADTAERKKDAEKPAPAVAVAGPVAVPEAAPAPATVQIGAVVQ